MKTYRLPLSYDTLNDDQKIAFGMLQYGLDSGQNYFLTGDAGVGKSYVINVYAEFCTLNRINLLKCAPTGTAATTIKGSTIHKMFRLPWTVASDKISSKQLENIYSMIQYADAIFIDEASMMRVDMLEAVMAQIAKADELRAKRSKPAIQVILSGDFGQLKPVVTQEDKKLFLEAKGREIGSGCCYESPVWAAADFKPIMLREQMRQSDKAFCKALDNIKIGIDSDLDYINANSSPVELPGGIWLCGLKDTAAEKNAMGLYRLPGELLFSDAIVTGKAKVSQTNYAERLMYKIGARVMMIKNMGDIYHNGSLGTIKAVNSDGTVKIALDAGREVDVGKVKTGFYEYKMDSNHQIMQIETGSVTQFPFKIGYAVTIHKAQGQTYDAMNLVPEIFAQGQLYTAMSRCKYLDRIYVQPDAKGDKLTPAKLMQDLETVKFLIKMDAEAAKYRAYFESTIGG